MFLTSLTMGKILNELNTMKMKEKFSNEEINLKKKR